MSTVEFSSRKKSVNKSEKSNRANKEILQIVDKKGKLKEDLQVAAIAIESKVSLEQVTSKKIQAMELYIDGCREEIAGIQGKICLTPRVCNVEASMNDCLLESMFEMKVGRMLYTTLQIWNAISA